ncbi:MAG: hypothetical protein R3C26_17410 [Calditrichia bacterium]
MKEIVEWHTADPARLTVDPQLDQKMDELVARFSDYNIVLFIPQRRRRGNARQFVGLAADRDECGQGKPARLPKHTARFPIPSFRNSFTSLSSN